MPLCHPTRQEKRNVPDKSPEGSDRKPVVLPHQEPAVEKPHMPRKDGWVGRPMVRKEESRLVRGCGKFIDDFKLPGMLHLHMVRSPYGHARIKSVDVSAADAHPGVVCTLTGAEVAKLTTPFIEIGPDPSARILDYCMWPKLAMPPKTLLN